MADDVLRYGMLIREVISVIEGRGWKLERAKGSHGQYVSPDGKHRVTITLHHKSAVAASPIIKKLQAAFLGGGRCLPQGAEGSLEAVESRRRHPRSAREPW